MKESEVGKLIAMLKVHHKPEKNQDGPELVSMWAIAMKHVPFDAAMIAYEHWILNETFFPKPREFREIILVKVCGLPSVDAAWAQLERSMRANYPGQPVKYTPDRLVIEASRVIGGAHALRNAQSGREFEALRDRFRAVYTEMRGEAADTVDIASEFAALTAGEPSPNGVALEPELTR